MLENFNVLARRKVNLFCQRKISAVELTPEEILAYSQKCFTRAKTEDIHKLGASLFLTYHTSNPNLEEKEHIRLLIETLSQYVASLLCPLLTFEGLPQKSRFSIDVPLDSAGYKGKTRLSYFLEDCPELYCEDIRHFISIRLIENQTFRRWPAQEEQYKKLLLAYQRNGTPWDIIVGLASYRLFSAYLKQGYLAPLNCLFDFDNEQTPLLHPARSQKIALSQAFNSWLTPEVAEISKHHVMIATYSHLAFPTGDLNKFLAVIHNTQNSSSLSGVKEIFSHLLTTATPYALELCEKAYKDTEPNSPTEEIICETMKGVIYNFWLDPRLDKKLRIFERKLIQAPTLNFLFQQIYNSVKMERGALFTLKPWQKILEA